MSRFNYLSFILFALVAFTNELQAAHIVGGEVNYNAFSFNSDSTVVTYQVNFTLYRDKNSGGADFDRAPETVFGIYRMTASGEWIYFDEVRGIDPSNIRDVELPDIPCFEEQEIVTYEQATYTFEVTFPVDGVSYLINYTRCCRNPLIVNLGNSFSTGFTWNAIISTELTKVKNSSPKFSESIPILSCVGEEITFDQSAIDSDGDELRYSLCAPLVAGGDTDATGGGTGLSGCCDCVRPEPQRCPPSFEEVIYFSPYSPTSPLGENSTTSIDALSGILTVAGDITGTFSIGICVEEYRDGILLGSYTRDVTMTILSCDPLPATNYYWDSDNDGYGDQDSIIIDCQSSAGYVLNADDCDDTDPNINPNAEEIPNNGIDEDCDGMDQTTSIDELPENEITIFPNPTVDMINISSSTDQSIPAIKIYSLTGQLMIHKTKATQINISNLPPGVYLLEWEGSNKMGVQKLIKS